MAAQPRMSFQAGDRITIGGRPGVVIELNEEGWVRVLLAEPDPDPYCDWWLEEVLVRWQKSENA